MYSISRVLIFLAFFLTIVVSGYSQDDKETARLYAEIAETMITETKALDDGREQMVRAADMDTTFIKANFEAGRLHLLTQGKDLAVKYFQRVYRQDPDYRFDIEFVIGRSYQYGLEFDKAIEYYERYKARMQKKPGYQGKDKVSLGEVERCIYECKNGKDYVASPGNFSIKNIGREINSEYEDYAPVFDEKEEEVVFTSRRKDDNLNENVYDDNKPFEDIFISHKKGGVWGKATNIGAPVNTPYHDSNLAISADGNTLFLYKDDNGGDIYFCERTNGVWGPPTPLPGIINSSFEEKSISISKDEKTLYFTSDRPGGYGGIDIYRATLDSKGQWGGVKNLGPAINTEYDEDGPFIDYDGVTFYFSSKGHKGMGGHDIYKTIYDAAKNEWSEPENLGYPINTPDDDVYFVSSPDGKRAYYSSVREDGMGYTDIYVITIPEGLKHTEPVTPKEEPKKEPVVEQPVVTTEPPKTDPVVVEQPKKEPVIEKPKKEPVVAEQPKKEPKKTEPKKVMKPLHYVVTVVDAESKAPMEARVRLQGANDNIIVPVVKKGGGVYEFNIKATAAKNYRLSIEQPGYTFVNQKLKIEGVTEEEKTLNNTIEMKKLAVRVSSILRNLYFDFDKATFKEESYSELNMLERMMKENTNLQVEISGHTDAVGSKAYNLFLSRKRAEAVKDFLTKKGIDARRVTAKGYGETKPLASNDDENEGREINRRVEFTVLGNK